MTPHRTPRGWRFGALRGSLLPVLATAISAAAQSASNPPASASTLDSVTRARVDSMFASYLRPDAPGCALLVRRDGATAYARGYGMASLELGVPITPATVMDIASTSKQFTATAVWMLALEGKLSLDDEVQRYLPELPHLGPGAAYRVTIRQLLQHTSGWPDYVDLLLSGGTPFEAAATAGDAMAVLTRQQVGNFAPGTAWTYSNTGYFLAAQIVERVSGMSLRDFLRTRVFAPLGMTHTDVFDDHTRLYPGHANGYSPAPGGSWRVERTNWEQTGDGAIQTSVEDLARWDANFDAPLVGGRALLDSLQQPAHLLDGTPTAYAYGLFVDSFRGLRRVHHGGGYPRVWVGGHAVPRAAHLDPDDVQRPDVEPAVPRREGGGHRARSRVRRAGRGAAARQPPHAVTGDPNGAAGDVVGSDDRIPAPHHPARFGGVGGRRSRRSRASARTARRRVGYLHAGRRLDTALALGREHRATPRSKGDTRGSRLDEARAIDARV